MISYQHISNITESPYHPRRRLPFWEPHRCVEQRVGPRAEPVEAVREIFANGGLKDGFDIASSISWELAMHTITGMTQVLRILNAEFSDRLSARDGKQ